MGRSKVRIVRDILQVVKDNNRCKKTTIVRLANLDWNMSNEYLESLIDDGLIERIQNEVERGGEDYEITRKGSKLLDALKKLENSVSVF